MSINGKIGLKGILIGNKKGQRKRCLAGKYLYI